MIDDELTHTDSSGKARMVDVSEKPPTRRTAIAEGAVHMAAQTLAAIRSNSLAKGDVIATARLAGIMAAKRTADLIPLCHPLALSKVDVDIVPADDPPRLEITAMARCTGPTGVEMEALTAATVSALTVYDMAKAMDRGMAITDVRLVEKSGGRSGHWKRDV